MTLDNERCRVAYLLRRARLGTTEAELDESTARGCVRGALYGSYPSLSDLDENGDLKVTTDFRSVYAGVLRDHLRIDPTLVLGGSFEPLSALAPVARSSSLAA
jgi:uncharacterized protein (DUF1501 family)